MQESFSKESFLKNNEIYEAYKKAFALIEEFIIGYIYIRVSSKKQTDNSPEAQLEALLEYALQHKIWIPIENIFVDGGISGRHSEKRTDFQKLVSLALDKKSNCRVILVDKYDRFYRNKAESSKYKADIKKAGVSIIAIKQPLPDDPIASLILESTYDVNAEIYSLNLSQEVYKGERKCAKKGKHQTRPGYGYKKIIKDVIHDSSRDKDVIIRETIIVEEEARVILLIYEILFSGVFWRRIASKLNELGLKTREGHSWYDARIWYILNNPLYLGYVRWTEKGCEPIIRKGNFPAIITQEMWDKKEKILKETKHLNNGKIIKSDVKNEHWLRGKLRCSNCGNTLVINGGSWQCCMYTHKGCNESHSIRVYMAEDIILNRIKNLKIDDIININIEEVRLKNNNEVAIVEDRLKQLKLQKDRVMLAYENDIYNIDEMKIRKLNIENEEKLLNEKLIKLKEQDDYKEIKNSILKRSANLYDILIDNDISILDKQIAIDKLIDKIIFDKKNKTFTFYWKGEL